MGVGVEGLVSIGVGTVVVGGVGVDAGFPAAAGAFGVDGDTRQYHGEGEGAAVQMVQTGCWCSLLVLAFICLLVCLPGCLGWSCAFSLLSTVRSLACLLALPAGLVALPACLCFSRALLTFDWARLPTCFDCVLAFL